MHRSISSTDRLLVVGPLYHVGAFDLPGVAVLEVGGSLIVLRDFDPEQTLATIQREVSLVPGSRR
jgi:fatty-acyl-CoA synthase